MDIRAAVDTAARAGASDLHLEPGQPVTIRVNGELQRIGSAVPARGLRDAIRQLVGSEVWGGFVERRSADLSKTIGGVRCRIAVLRSARGVGVAIRLLSGQRVSIQSLNLHPSLRELAFERHGIVVVTGPTGSGKSTTIAALAGEINAHQARHIVTLEQPIEHAINPLRSLVRQREVGRDTPSFEQGIMDVLREDPDVVVVGEMRWPKTIRLTLTAAETGHLVFTTVHASSCSEAIGRIVSAFTPEEQPTVRAMLADCLVAVVAQQLHYREDLGIRVPVLEVLRANDAVRNIIRTGQHHKVRSIIETNADTGMFSRARYSRWLSSYQDWSLPPAPGTSAAPDLTPAPTEAPHARPAPTGRRTAPPTRDGVLVLDGFEDDPAKVLSEFS